MRDTLSLARVTFSVDGDPWPRDLGPNAVPASRALGPRVLHCSLSYPRPLTLTSLPRNLPTRLNFDENFIVRLCFHNHKKKNRKRPFLVKSWESYYFIWCTIFLQMVIKEISYVYIKEICCDKDKWYPISIGKWERREIQEFLDLYFIDILRRY